MRTRHRPSRGRAGGLALALALGACLLAAPGLATPDAAGATDVADVADVRAAAPAAAEPARNIVLITTDDQADFELRYMPQTRRLLGEQGIEFTDAINPHPLCCPARAEILTGEYAQNNGVHDNTHPRFGGWDAFAGWNDGENLRENIATWLQDAPAEYRTGFVGKMLNGYKAKDGPPERMPGWDYWSPTLKGTYAYYGTQFLNDRWSDRHTFPKKYVADVVRDQTVRQIDRWSGGDRPFFLWASHVGPHTKVSGPKGSPDRVSDPIPARRHRGEFADLRLPTRDKDSFNERVIGDKAPAVAKRATRDVGELTSLFRNRVRALQAVDEANAAVVEALRRNGELDDTVIVFVTDNGFFLGEHRLQGKNYPYAENLQIPFLMRAPDAAAGSTSGETATLLDLAPTFLDYAGEGVLEAVRSRGQTDGLSLRAHLAGEPMPTQTTLIQAGSPGKEWFWRGVRTPRYTLAQWPRGRTESGQPRYFYELFDRRTDGGELRNLVRGGRAADVAASHREVFDALLGRLEALRDCRGVEECEGQQFDPLPPAG